VTRTDRPLTATLAVVSIVLLAWGVVERTGHGGLLGSVLSSPSESSSPYDTGRRTVDRLDPDLLAAVREATADARADGVRIRITSGWRSHDHQVRLWDEAVQRYGSEEEAQHWVARPGTSTHETGDAVDIGPTEAADWMSRHGSAYGLCQTFANEIWHYELATEPGGECPAMLPDGSYR
jgi:zinc D-Ala-D-Ala carboxypeptidase